MLGLGKMISQIRVVFLFEVTFRDARKNGKPNPRSFPFWGYIEVPGSLGRCKLAPPPPSHPNPATASVDEISEPG